MRSLLACFAHPDDESFTTGGALARYAAQGARTTLVCATRGEVGEISDPSLATPDTLGYVRELELRRAVAAMKLNEVIFLDYRDSGMMGTPENQDARAFCNQDPEVVIGQLVAIIRRVKPQVIVTFDPNGGYGHPDHITIHKHTMAAAEAAGDASRYPEAGEPWTPARVFWSVIPRSFFEERRKAMEAQGQDVSGMLERAQRMGWADDQVTTWLDVSPWVEQKHDAVYSHRSQLNPNSPVLRQSPEDRKKAMGREAFILAWPSTEAPPEARDDLFGGLDA